MPAANQEAHIIAIITMCCKNPKGYKSAKCSEDLVIHSYLVDVFGDVDFHLMQCHSIYSVENISSSDTWLSCASVQLGMSLSLYHFKSSLSLLNDCLTYSL